MAGEAREILRLHRCPGCNYDLTGLPAAHRCPECGYEYDETMFDLEAWWPSVWQRPLGITPWGGILATFVLLVICAGAPVVGFGIILLAALGTAIASITMFVHRRQRVPDIVFLMQANGFMWRRPKAKGSGTWAWRAFRSARVRRLRRSRWRLVLARRAWFADSPIRVIIAGDRRTAAVVRNEIRRRIRAANETD